MIEQISHIHTMSIIFSFLSHPCYFNVAPGGFQPVHFPSNLGGYTEESFLVTLMDTKAIEIRKPVATANLSSISLSSFTFFLPRPTHLVTHSKIPFFFLMPE